MPHVRWQPLSACVSDAGCFLLGKCGAPCTRGCGIKIAVYHGAFPRIRHAAEQGVIGCREVVKIMDRL